MAGDWIKMRVGLTTNPRVMRIAECLLEDARFMEWAGLSYGIAGYPPPPAEQARAERHPALRVTRYVTVTALLRWWGYANEHTKGEEIAGLFPEARNRRCDFVREFFRLLRSISYNIISIT